MKKNGLQILTLCLCVVLLVIVVIQGRQIQEYKFQLDYRLDEMEQSLSNEIYHISSNLAWELEEADKAVTDYSLEPVGIDWENRALLADVSVTLKEWYEDTAVTLMATMGEEDVTMPLTMGEDGACSGRLSLPLEGNSDLFLTARISGGGLIRQEELGGWGDYSMLLPLRQAGGGWSGPEYQDGVLTCSYFEILIERTDGDAVMVQNPEFWFYRNGELVQTLEAVNDPHNTSDSGYYYGVDSEDHAWSIECGLGDSIEVRFRCEDEFGLGYDFPFQSWVVEGETSEDEFSVSGYDGSAGLTLFWPE